MSQVNLYTFPTNVWIHKNTKNKESDKCDLYKTLWLEEGWFKTEKDLSEEDLGHIQHTCEYLSVTQIDTHQWVTTNTGEWSMVNYLDGIPGTNVQGTRDLDPDPRAFFDFVLFFILAGVFFSHKK